MKLKGAPAGGRGAGCVHSLLTPTGWHLGKDFAVRTRSSEDQGHCRAGSAQALGAPCAHPHGTGWQEALPGPPSLVWSPVALGTAGCRSPSIGTGRRAQCSASLECF